MGQSSLCFFPILSSAFALACSHRNTISFTHNDANKIQEFAVCGTAHVWCAFPLVRIIASTLNGREKHRLHTILNYTPLKRHRGAPRELGRNGHVVNIRIICNGFAAVGRRLLVSRRNRIGRGRREKPDVRALGRSWRRLPIAER